WANRSQGARKRDAHRHGADALRQVFGQRNAGGVQKAQAGGGFKRGRGNRLARVRLERIGGRSVKESALGEVKRRPAGERAKNRRRRRTLSGGEREFVIAIAVFGRTELQPQRLGRARERLAIASHDAVRRQRQAEQAVER